MADGAERSERTRHRFPPVPAAAGERPVIGLALGSGAARGWAHLGVLRRLDELGVPIDCVAGTSAGALVGAVYLAGRLDLLEALSRRLDWCQMARLFFEVNFPRSGLLTGRNVARFLQEVVGVDMIEALDRPFAAVATDLLAHHERVFTQGSLIDAIRASISIPGVFTPARCGDRDLVDGALVNPLPVSVLRAMGAARIIAVDVNPARLTLARKLGATHIVNGAEEDVVDRIRSIVPRGVRFVFDTSVRDTSWDAGAKSLCMVGTLATVNAPHRHSTH